uniref:Lipocalin n=1 Tax=Rhipicephalus zambeziensis TaxID=60191 RepID=A0A224YHP4_9ACAR
MALYLPCVLFTCIFVCALSNSDVLSLHSQHCAVEMGSAIYCVNRTSNYRSCRDANGSGPLCVNVALNSTSCREEMNMTAIEEEAMKQGHPDENEPPKYPLPASQNMLFLVGYSQGLQMPQYPCVASKFQNFSDNSIYRKLLLKKEKTKGSWDEKIPIQLYATLCSMRMNVTRTCKLTSKVRVKSQYLMLRYTWNSMVLSDLFEKVTEKPLCSLWAKNEYKDNVERYIRYYFNVTCKDAVYTGYPQGCPETE